MSPGYGTVARTPVSHRDPHLLRLPEPAVPAGSAVNHLDQATPGELLRLGLTLLVEPTDRQRNTKQLATGRVLSWLDSFSADTWQGRWLRSGGDSQPPGWVPQEFAGQRRWQYFTGIGVLIVLGAVRPSYPWLFGNRPQHLYDAYRRRHQPATFTELDRAATTGAGPTHAPTHARDAMTTLTRLAIITGKDLADIDHADLSAYAAARAATGRHATALVFVYDLLRGIAAYPTGHRPGSRPPPGGS